MRNRVFGLLAMLVLALAPLTALHAQTGRITGRITDRETKRPLAGARVEALAGGRSVKMATSAETGSYVLADLAPGVYSVRVARIGYGPETIPGVQVTAGGSTEISLSLEASAVQLNETVVTASRVEETILDAPATIAAVPEAQIVERPSVTITDQLKSVPGIDIIQGGVNQAFITGRGFNNIFSGTLLVLNDNRFARLPGLNANIPTLFPIQQDDIERIEVQLGAGAALYGPNSAQGVLNVITKSPFTSKGTTVSLIAGERSMIGGSFRHAGVFGTRFGYKVSGEYNEGRDWEFNDPLEFRTVRDRASGQLVSNQRDFLFRRFSGQARLDWQVSDKTLITANYGRAQAINALDYTGLGVAQIRNWAFNTFGLQLRSGRLFLQAFGNIMDAGNRDSLDNRGTFLFGRAGNDSLARVQTPTRQTIVDLSRVWAVQAQHGFNLGGRQDFTYGVDYINTDPRSGGTIYGRNEADNNINEVGAYVLSRTKLGNHFELTGAARVDWHSRLADPVFSPRVALQWKPNADMNFRVSYNRAFSTPAANNLFIDLPVGASGPYGIRAIGTPEAGLSYNRTCAAGVGGLCMRTPFSADPTAFVPAAAAPGWPVLVNSQVAPSLVPQLQAGIAGAIQQAAANPALGGAGAILNANRVALANAAAAAAVSSLATAPTAAQVPVGLALPQPPLLPLPIQPTDVADIQRLRPQITNQFEVGYKGIIRNKLLIDVSGYYSKISDFITPLQQVAPLVLAAPTQLGSYIGGQLGAGIGNSLGANIVSTLTANGVPLTTAQSIAATVAPQIASGVAASATPNLTRTLAGVPFGTVTPDNPLTQRPEILLSYRNAPGSFDLFGVDLAAEYLLTNQFSVQGTYSWMSKDLFALQGVAGQTLAVNLNAPKSKGTVALRFREGNTGLSAEIRGRFVTGFPVNSGIFVGYVDAYEIFDAQIAYRWALRDKQTLLVSLAATNVFDNRYRTLVGLPEIGRLILSKVSVTF